jgi:hypothetical protein
MKLANADLIVGTANADAEFQLAARLWTGSVCFKMGADSFLLEMREGRIESLAPAEISLPGEVTISAPDADWREMLKPVPKPFFQDLMAAISRQDFHLEGSDLVAFYPYYRATCRLIEIMRAISA